MHCRPNRGDGTRTRWAGSERRTTEQTAVEEDRLAKLIFSYRMTSRRSFLAALAAPLAAQAAEPIIDIHQHTNYTGRSDDELIRHQREMGVSKTVLLPAGSKYGLAAGAGGNDTVVAIARALPKE